MDGTEGIEGIPARWSKIIGTLVLVGAILTVVALRVALWMSPEMLDAIGGALVQLVDGETVAAARDVLASSA